MAQTSVEWLIMQLPVSIRVELYEQNIHKQAKEIHKEELDKSYKKGLVSAKNTLEPLYQKASEKYAEFCVKCDREGMKLLDFNDYIKL
jgi:uncharacterized protein HemY